MKKIVFVLLFLFMFPVVSAEPSKLVLLTVATQGDQRMGGTADLFLDVKRGSGRIFIDSFPLTKLDTQISTRFANEIACMEGNLDCDYYDFFYTIKADSSIVGGPSAGIGVAVLTIASLKGLEINESVTLTGSINSGGIVGPVDGIYEKIVAAQKAGLKKVLVPKWVDFNKSVFESETNTTLTIEVVKIASLDDAVQEVTGFVFDRNNADIEVSEKYLNRMEAVADILCARTDEIVSRLKKKPDLSNFTMRVEAARNSSRFYSVASFCFSKNVELRTSLLNETIYPERLRLMSKAGKDIAKLDKDVDDLPLRTLSDLETYMVVKERLIDASQGLAKVDVGTVPPEELSYAMERYFSALSWSKFYGLGGKAFHLDDASLRNACEDKISEAEERLNYVHTISPKVLPDTRKDLNLAYLDLKQGKHSLCIFKAVKAKAEADTFLMAMYVKEDALSSIIFEKLESTKKVILAQVDRGVFPVLGFSYYEYSESLREVNTYSSLLFSEYALEMSNLNLYFPSEDGFVLPDIDYKILVVFLFGLILGLFIGVMNNSKKS